MCRTIDDRGVTIEDRVVSIENRGVSIEDRGVTIEDRGVSIEDRGVTIEDRGVTIDRTEAESDILRPVSRLPFTKPKRRATTATPTFYFRARVQYAWRESATESLAEW